MKLNLGCGDKKVEGYTGVDLDSRADIVCDIRDLAFCDSNSVDEILSVHVIEHFYKWQVQGLLWEWRRVLKPGGKIILECPNLELACMAFLQGAPDQFTMWAFYGNPNLKNELHCHHWGWTPTTLSEELKQAGFKDIQSKKAQFKIPTRDMRVEAIK